MAVTITRTLGTDDDGSGTTGTVVNTAWKTEFYNQIDTALAAVSGVVQTTTATGTQHDFALTAGAGRLRCTNASLLTLTGLAAGYDGQQLSIVAGVSQVDIANQNAGSAVANRIINNVTGTISLAPTTGRATLEYDAAAQRWRVIAHDQGAWITPTFAAGNFTGSASMTWTVDAGDVTTFRYHLRGRTLTINFYLVSTSVGGTPDKALRILIPGGFTAAGRSINLTLYTVDNGGAAAAGYAYVSGAAATLLECWKLTETNWAAATNATNVFGTVVIEVQ